MTVETLRAQTVASLGELAWDQWSQLGVSGAAPARREERAADPEALLLFTLAIGRTDPRLFDEVLDWLAVNESLVSVHRLRNLCGDATDRALVEAALVWVAREGRRRRVTPGARPSGSPADLQPLFPAVPPPRGDPDTAFSRHGFARESLAPSGRSREPRLGDPISFAFRLRRLLGVGVRAEVLRALLTIRARRISGRVISASAGFSQRNVREGLSQLHEAGVVDVVEVSDDRHYSVRADDWATLLTLPSTPDLPIHHDWIPTYRALTRVLRWLEQPEIDALSPYLRASRARTLVTEIAADLRLIGVWPGLDSSGGVDFWDEFVGIVGALIRDSRAQPPATGHSGGG